MRESGWYPPGAEFDPSAPYNQVEVPEKDFEITCSQSLSRTATVVTNNYIPCCDEGYDDGVGYHDEWADTSDTNWSDEYDENGYKTPLQLIQMLKEYLQKDLEKWEEEDRKEPYKWAATQVRKLKGLIEECDCWTEDETDFELD